MLTSEAAKMIPEHGSDDEAAAEQNPLSLEEETAFNKLSKWRQVVLAYAVHGMGRNEAASMYAVAQQRLSG
jgi:hypothetical protein